MKMMKKVQLAVMTILVVGTIAMGSEVQARGVEVFLPPLPPFPSIVFSPYDRHNHHGEYRPRHRPSQVCWQEGGRGERRHGRYRNELRTVCRDRDWRGNHGGWRDEHRGRDRW